MAQPVSTSRSIPSLDGLRALSIGAVILGHAKPSLPPALTAIPGWSYLSNGSLGVTIFFVISGFLITQLLLKEEDATGKISLSRFYLRRSFRIFPPFYLYLAVIGILWMTRALTLDWRSFLSAATYTWNYYPRADGWFIAHVWSLSLEEQFYLCWPACLLIAGRRRALRIAIGFIALAPAVRVATYFLAPALRGHMSMMLHTRLDTLLFGCVLALLWKDEQFQSRLQTFFRPAILALTAFFLIFASAFLGGYFRGSYGLPFGMTLDAALIAFLMAYLVQNPNSLPGKALNSRVLRHMGIISYSLYVWQQLYLSPMFPIFPINIILLVLTAELSFRLIERPAVRLRDYTEMKLGLKLIRSTESVATPVARVS